MPYTTLLIDLDDTVYPPSTGMWDAIASRIDRFMHERLAIPASEIPFLRRDLHTRYGTTLRGLAATRAVDELEYLAFVHDLPVGQYLRPDPMVRAALQAVPLRKWIFTNADRAHARRVLSALDLDDLFEGVIDIHDVRPYCKPMPQAYHLALERAGASPQECIFFDDALPNLLPAREMGVMTVLVGARSAPSGFPSIPSLAYLSQVVESIEAG